MEKHFSNKIETQTINHPESYYDSLELKKLETEPKELTELLDEYEFLKDIESGKKNFTKYYERAGEIYEKLDSFIKSNGGKEVEDISDFYRSFESRNEKPVIIRRDHPSRVSRLVAGEDVPIVFDPKVVSERGDKYANCDIWPHGKGAVLGIQNAFTEGHTAAGPLVTLIGVRQNRENNHLKDAIGKEMVSGTSDRTAVRIVSGKLSKEDLNFLIVRLPKRAFKENDLKSDEIKFNSSQIFRAYTF